MKTAVRSPMKDLVPFSEENIEEEVGSECGRRGR